jgi:hypothetical protein
MDKAEVPIKPVILIVTFGLAVLGILSFAVPKLFKKETENIQPSADVSEVAALIASKLARNRPDNAESGDLLEAFVPNDIDRAFESERLAKSAAPMLVTPQVSPPQPHKKATSDEYWAKADACLAWAREASTDEVRLRCLALAQTWLSVALRIDGGAPPTLPRAPTLQGTGDDAPARASSGQ